jgi:ribosomal protein L11 methyltransferase
MSGWVRLVLEPRGTQDQFLIAELWTAGTVGIEERVVDGRPRLDAYFAVDAEGEIRERLGRYPWTAFGARLLAIEPVAAADWMSAFRARARPFPLGHGFMVDPGEPSACDEAPEGRHLLRLPARRAFGIGSHESTRLVVEFLEEIELEGSSVLDVGTGTGILAMVARARGARWVVGVDIDLSAVWTARDNLKLNRLNVALGAGSTGCLRADARFDLALVNVVPEEIAGELRSIARLLRPQGRAVFSGMLTVDAADFEASIGAAGLAPVGRRRDGEWTAVLAQRRGQ